MAETVVRLVLGKLADEVIKELALIYGVCDKVERVRRDLTCIQSFLKDADSKRQKDERVKNWVNEVREVGYLIEDTLDKFFIEVDGGRSEHPQSSFKRIGKKLMQLNAKHKLSKDVNKIHQRIHEISENTVRFGIEGLKDTGASFNLPVRPLMIPDIDETEVIGFEVDRKRIVDQLTDTNITRRSVLSIVGAGGSGKTTLAKEVYNSAEIRKHFTRLWLTASEDYKLIDILFKMLEGIQQHIDLDGRQKGDQVHLTRELYNSLKEKRYLVVLDDVWTSDLWTQLEIALPNTANGSRVLITTRFLNIAEEADAKSEPYELKGLNEEESQQLLLKKIFPNQYASECPSDLLSLIPDIARKCDGWPLALVVLGGILSRKNPSYDAWDGVMQKMDWHTDGIQCMGVISTSYEFLPSNMKPCFLYFAAFPEDHQIKAATLIQLWIAEGFISSDASKTMEEIAESYLEELVQRCMVQVSSRSLRGKIKYCYAHDLLRELAIQKAKEANFLTVFSKNGTHLSDSNSARRVALNFCGNTQLNHACANLRSLTYFGDDIEICQRFELLRVLNVELSGYFEHDGEWLKSLISLRYFGFKRPSDWFEFCVRPYGPMHELSYLTQMRNLQIVDLPILLCNTQGLPPSFWDNKLLRHAVFKPCFKCNRIEQGPQSSADLPNLQTLKGVAAQPEWGSRLPHFPRLHKLAVIIPQSVVGDTIVNSLSNLQYLDSLSLDEQKVAFPWFKQGLAFPCFISQGHKRLRSFGLKKGLWRAKALVGIILFPPHLVKIKLSTVVFAEDPMPQLEKLPNLRVLDLQGDMIARFETQMICSKVGFGSLKTLLLTICDLEEWKIEEGAMPMLNRLELVCTDLKIAPDLQYLTSLQQLKVNYVEYHLIPKCHSFDQWEIIKLTMFTWLTIGSGELSDQ